MNYLRDPKVMAKIDESKSKSYIKLNDSDRTIQADDLLKFVESIVSQHSNAKSMIKNGQVTVNGYTILDPSHIVVVGDDVRVAEGHYLKNSNFRARAI